MLELDLKEFGATIAAGTSFLLGAFLLLLAAGWASALRSIVQRLGVPHTITVLVLLVAAFETGLITESLSHELVHGAGHQLLPWVFKSETALRAKALYGRDNCCSDVSELAVEAADAQLFGKYAGDPGSRVQAAIQTGGRLLSSGPQGDRERAAGKLFYFAKNIVYREPTFYAELHGFETKISFARSLEFLSAVLLVLATCVMLWGLLLWGLRLPRQAQIAKRGLGAVMLFAMALFTAEVAYDVETIEFARRAYGYFVSVEASRLQGAGKPRNIGDLKEEVRHYVDVSGAYSRDMEKVFVEAEASLPCRRNAKEAIILDIDETALSNWPALKAEDFGYVKDRWDRWVAQASAPAVEATLHFYSKARRLECAMFFITLRPESQRRATETNLRRVGFEGWQEVIMRPDDRAFDSAADFKSEKRRRLVEAGWKIKLNIGDQPSDLAGGFAEKGVLLPDPFYRIP